MKYLIVSLVLIAGFLAFHPQTGVQGHPYAEVTNNHYGYFDRQTFCTDDNGHNWVEKDFGTDPNQHLPNCFN